MASPTDKIYQKVTNYYSSKYISSALLFTNLPFTYMLNKVTKQQFSYLDTMYHHLLPHNIISIITNLSAEDLYDDIRDVCGETIVNEEHESHNPSRGFVTLIVESNMLEYACFGNNMSADDVYIINSLGFGATPNTVAALTARKPTGISQTCTL